MAHRIDETATKNRRQRHERHDPRKDRRPPQEQVLDLSRRRLCRADRGGHRHQLTPVPGPDRAPIERLSPYHAGELAGAARLRCPLPAFGRLRRKRRGSDAGNGPGR